MQREYLQMNEHEMLSHISLHCFLIIQYRNCTSASRSPVKLAATNIPDAPYVSFHTKAGWLWKFSLTVSIARCVVTLPKVICKQFLLEINCEIKVSSTTFLGLSKDFLIVRHLRPHQLGATCLWRHWIAILMRWHHWFSIKHHMCISYVMMFSKTNFYTIVIINSNICFTGISDTALIICSNIKTTWKTVGWNETFSWI